MYLSYHVHNGFLIFMRQIQQKLSNEMFSENYWSRSLQEIVKLKSKRKNCSSGGSTDMTEGSRESLLLSNKRIT